MAEQTQRSTDDGSLRLTIGHEQIVIGHRYQMLSILNDFLIGIWFTVGSWLFFYPSLENVAIWLFVIGSAQFLVRPIIRLAHHFHLQQMPSNDWDM